MAVLNSVECHSSCKNLFVLIQYQSVTDSQSERRTDRRLYYSNTSACVSCYASALLKGTRQQTRDSFLDCGLRASDTTIQPIFWIIRPNVRSNGRSYKMLVMFFFFRHAFSEVPRPIAVKLGHMIGNCLSFIIQVQKFGRPPQKNLGAKNMQNFGRYNLPFWSRISPERLKISKIGKLIFLDRFLLPSVKKVRWTLAHRLQRSWCEFGPIKMHFFGILYFSH